jgi:hypothetical protein
MRQSFLRVAPIAMLLQVATSPMALWAGSREAPVAIDALPSVGQAVTESAPLQDGGHPRK